MGNDRWAGKYKRFYKDEFRIAKSILAKLGKLSWSQNDYEAFRFVGEDVCLIFYPHKTSAGNHHIRVRNQNSKNKERAIELMRALDEATGPNCTFTYKRGL